ncbi:MAG: hypothetical protein GEU90_18385 [Gemmatimonas sp.]|nr:hypothetical protein [Gemmatimonas sp.]
MNSKLRWSAAIGGGTLVLLYLTLNSLPDPPPTGIEHTADEAAVECEQAVADEVAGAHFPFPATATYLGDAEYRLDGTVEAEASGGVVRSNYECFVRFSEANRYRTDSLTVWQSH